MGWLHAWWRLGQVWRSWMLQICVFSYYSRRFRTGFGHVGMPRSSPQDGFPSFWDYWTCLSIPYESIPIVLGCPQMSADAWSKDFLRLGMRADAWRKGCLPVVSSLFCRPKQLLFLRILFLARLWKEQLAPQARVYMYRADSSNKQQQK